MTSDPVSPTLAKEVEGLASQCVKCALCLPHCPTYELTLDENESPRGRIALFQALSQEKLPLTAKVKKHLDQCLGCRACERVCPAHVEYGQLLTLGRAQIKQLPTEGSLPSLPLTTRFLAWIARVPKAQRLLHRFLWGLERVGLRQLARQLRIPQLLGLQALDELLPSVPKPIAFNPYYEAIGSKRGSVMLFTGCITSWCDQETLAASIFIVQRLGYEVWVPPNQTCCGAIDLHAGEMGNALLLAKQNILAFNPDPSKMDFLLTTATGCSAVLQEYDRHFSSHANQKNEDFSSFSKKVLDIISFIQQCEWPADLIPKPLPMQVILHTPCTRRNVLKSPFHPEQLLARIPKLQWQSFQSPHCCGAAGTYMLDHPTLSEPLIQKLCSELDDIQVNFVATSNIGCALQFQRQLKNLKRSIKVIHPVVLLAKALGF